ncbi:hypothetical protein C8J57DRAFT_1731019 [Mycena rebaudengoi]|nr:hypothetical protein C8J57DRAFT_1731019 [Mycena rebaudengoi]
MSFSAAAGSPSTQGRVAIDMSPRTIPILVGSLQSWILFGALFMQIGFYFIAFPSDRRATKILVVCIFIAEILETMFDLRNTVDLFGSGWGNPQALDRVGWAWFSTPVIGSIVAAVGQNFFAYRIYILSSKWWIPGLIAILTAVELVTGIWTGAAMCSAKQFSRLQAGNIRITTVWLATSALCDSIIVASTTYYLTKSRNPDFRRQTNAALTRIIKVTVETGVFCAVFALMDLALLVGYKNSYHLAVCMPLSKVYSNSIMLILNSRAYIQGRAPEEVHVSDFFFKSEARGASVLVINTTRQTDDVASDAEHERHEHKPSQRSGA